MKYMKIFVEFADWLEELSRPERGDLFMAMLRYSRDGELPTLKGKTAVLWAVAKTHLDRMREEYDKTCAVNAANARKKSASRGDGKTGKAGRTKKTEKTGRADAGESAADLREDAAGEETAAREDRPLGRRPAVVEALPLAGGGEYPVFSHKAEEWGKLFPGVDVTRELLRMRDWLRLHPERLEREKDVIPFILRWLEKRRREQTARVPADPGPRRPSYDLDEIEAFILDNSCG